MASSGGLHARRFLSADLLPTERGAVARMAIRFARAPTRHAASLPPRRQQLRIRPLQDPQPRPGSPLCRDRSRPANGGEGVQRTRVDRARGFGQRARAAFGPYPDLPTLRYRQMNTYGMKTVSRGLRLQLITVLAVLACAPTYGTVSVSPEEMGAASSWVAAKSRGATASEPPAVGLMVLPQYSVVRLESTVFSVPRPALS